MQQLELFEYRRDCLFDSKNQIAHYFDILKETKDNISYAEHIEPNSGLTIAGMSYEADEYKDKIAEEVEGEGLNNVVLSSNILVRKTGLSFARDCNQGSSLLKLNTIEDKLLSKYFKLLGHLRFEQQNGVCNEKI